MMFFLGTISANGEHSGFVGECLTQDWEAAGSSLTGVTALCPWARRIIPSYSTGSTQEDLSLHNWKIVDGTLRIKSNKNHLSEHACMIKT